jgi:hypothetical protein
MGHEGCSCVIHGPIEDHKGLISIEKVGWIVASSTKIKRGTLRRVLMVEIFHICHKINL